jgi:predicted RNase H-like nuclease (RuvC/YqgF family)
MAQLEVNTEKKSKKKWFIIAGVILVLSIVYSIGNGAAKADIDGVKVNYEELTAKIKAKEKELESINAEIKEVDTKLADSKMEFDKAMEVIANKDEAQSMIDEIKKEVGARQNEIKFLDSQIKEKQNELNTVIGKVKEKDSQPIVLSAGQYFVGKDIPIGRYKAVANGGSGNFVVYSASNDLMVNTILGGRIGESEYVFYATEGAYMELSTSVKFIGVE